MRCRQCGTEIAEKALICYKCGTATTEARFAPVPIRDEGRPRRFAVLIVLVVVLLLGVYAGETATDDSVRTSGWVVAVVAVLLLAGRLLLGRRR